MKMRLKIMVMLFSLIYIVSGRNHVKTLTESNGQEVIEIGSPIKELPMGLEEEPGADDDDDDEKDSKTSAKTQVPATKKESKKITTLASVKKDATTVDVEKSEDSSQDEDEAKIEKELAEIYKDTADYKTDTEEKEVAKELPTTVLQTTSEATYDGDDTAPEEADKPIARQKANFRFQPESHDAADVERFRTSVDEISCNNRLKLKGTPIPIEQPEKPESPPTPNDAFRTISNGIILITAVLSYVFICT